MPELTELQAAQIEITNQINAFYMALDDRDFDVMARIIAPEGCWYRAGKELRGPEGLLAEMSKRPDSRHSRHLVTNVLTTLSGPDTATVRYYCTAFVHIGETGERGAAPSDVPSSIGVITSTWQRQNGSWLLMELKSFPAFKRGALG